MGWNLGILLILLVYITYLLYHLLYCHIYFWNADNFINDLYKLFYNL